MPPTQRCWLQIDPSDSARPDSPQSPATDPARATFEHALVITTLLNVLRAAMTPIHR